MLDGTTYPFAFAYNDAGMPTSTTYSDGEVTQPTYTPQGWLSGLFTTPSGGAITPLFTNLAYQGVGGAAMQPTYATVGTTPVSFSADYNNNLQTTDLRLTRQASGRGTSAVVLFDQQRGFDGAGNVTSISTTLPAGTDTQAFCYDEQDRLTWASSQSGSGPCGGTNTAGTLTSGSAQYTQSFAYDALDRLTSGPQGSFIYGPGLQAPTNPAPLHGVVALGSTAYSYDPAGDRLNAGLTTGDVYDAERQLVSWSTPGGTTSGKDAYDGEGHRVAHQTTSAGTTTTTYYLGGLEEVTSGTLTKFEAAAPGLPTAVKVGTTLSYLASDGLGSIAAALDATGTVTAQQLYAPYGSVRYTSGSLPTTNGFTGQRADAASGLDYYNARYYDPATAQFTSADAVLDGLNRYAYVADNPTSRIDPTGHLAYCIGMLIHPPSSVADWVGAGGGCAGDLLMGVRGFVQAHIGNHILGVALSQYGSGNPVFLTTKGFNDLTTATGKGAYAKLALSNLRDIRGILPGLGKSTESTEFTLDEVERILNIAGDARTVEGVGGGPSPLPRLLRTLAGDSSTLERWGTVAKVAGWVGIGITWAASGIEDYSTHHDPVRAFGVGALHAGLSAGGAWFFGGLGALGGSMFGPAGTAIGAFAGASFGAWAGDQLAGLIVDQVDNGNVAGAYNTVATTLSNAGDTFSNAICGAENWGLSLFGM